MDSETERDRKIRTEKEEEVEEKEPQNDNSKNMTEAAEDSLFDKYREKIPRPRNETARVRFQQILAL